jgi:folylpolyglutamate synthase
MLLGVLDDKTNPPLPTHTHTHTHTHRHPIVCGITLLDLDHTELLGTTLADIAWHKAGIMKQGSIAFTYTQKTEAVDVLIRRSDELEVGYI